MLRSLLFSLGLFAASLAQANEGANERYEALLSELAGSATKSEADRISGEIWQIWLTAPDPAAQMVLDAALERRMSQDFLGAIKELDTLIAGWPDYAEGWNQRATIYWMLGRFEASLADVEEVLAREPRHFGALSGKAVILAGQGKIGLAQIAVREALKYHPHLNEAAILGVNPGQEL
jgi:tetratricopeptide (TPR) repeat protein